MKSKRRPSGSILIWLLLAMSALSVSAHDGSHASVHDTVAGIISRMERELSAEQLLQLTVTNVEAFLTAREREVLGTAHVRFRVNVPVVVTIVPDTSLGNEPFWLGERGFNPTGLKVSL